MWLINKIKTYSCNDRTLVKVFHVRLSEWCHQESTIEYMQLMVLNWNHFLNDGELHFLLISTSWSYKHTPVDARSRLTLQFFTLPCYHIAQSFILIWVCFVSSSSPDFPFGNSATSLPLTQILPRLTSLSFATLSAKRKKSRLKPARYTPAKILLCASIDTFLTLSSP